MKNLYVIIETGYEGIESLLYVTKSPKKVIKKVAQLRKNAIKKKRKILLEIYSPDILPQEEFQRLIKQAGDFICVQKWDGHKFDCACNELGVNPSELMLR